MGDGEPHRCEEKVQKDVKVRPDLQATPLTEPEETLYTDGCCFRHPQEGLTAAFAVVRQTKEGFEEVVAERVKGKESAQLAELQAMIKALERAEGKEVNIARKIRMCGWREEQKSRMECGELQTDALCCPVVG